MCRTTRAGDDHRRALSVSCQHRAFTVKFLPQPVPDRETAHAEPAFNRTTGVGFVAPYAGDYRGRAPHVPLTLVHSETTGALSPESLKSIAHLDKLANKPAHRDGTQYGSRRGATRSFRRHHTSEISSAIVYADAETLLAHAEGAPV